MDFLHVGGTNYKMSCPKGGRGIREGGGPYYKNLLPNRGLYRRGENRGRRGRGVG